MGCTSVSRPAGRLARSNRGAVHRPRGARDLCRTAARPRRAHQPGEPLAPARARWRHRLDHGLACRAQPRRGSRRSAAPDGRAAHQPRRVPRGGRHQLEGWRTLVRAGSVAYVPAQQGYIVATVSRALYTLATGEQTSKEKAVTWFADNHPQDADFVWAAYRAYRANVREAHERLSDSWTRRSPKQADTPG